MEIDSFDDSMIFKDRAYILAKTKLKRVLMIHNIASKSLGVVELDSASPDTILGFEIQPQLNAIALMRSIESPNSLKNYGSFDSTLKFTKLVPPVH